MAGSSGGAPETEKLIVRVQKSTNQLKALLAKLLPGAAEGGGGGGGEESSGAVDAILSDISESLCEALASLRLGASGDRRLSAPPDVSLSACGQSVMKSGGRPVSTSSQRRSTRMDDSSRRIILLQHGDRGDSYLWRKYGQKDILGARFARSYFRCAHRASCSAKKQVQQSDADPSRLVITYIGAHTCGDRASPPCTIPTINYPDDTRCNSASHRRPPAAAAAVPSTLKTLEDHVSASDSMACTPSMEQEIASWLFIPSPACSQSELLSAAVAEVPELLMPDASPAPVEQKKACDGEFTVDDSVVPGSV